MTIAKKTVIRDEGQQTVRVTCLDNAGRRYEVTVNSEQIIVGDYETAMKKYEEV